MVIGVGVSENDGGMHTVLMLHGRDCRGMSVGMRACVCALLSVSMRVCSPAFSTIKHRKHCLPGL